MAAPLRTDRETAFAEDVDRRTIRVMIVDDSLTVRTVFTRMIGQERDMAIVGAASSAERALAELRSTRADVILLDLEMPGMGGLEALPALLALAAGARVLVVSSLTAEGAEHTVRALSMGAADTMLKPRPGGFDEAYRKTLLDKVRALKTGRTVSAVPYGKRRATATRATRRPRVVAIGASTGGIHALNLFLRGLPADFDLPILVTQHLPPTFMHVFARQMEVAAGREAVLADEATEITRGRIIIAPGHGHLVVRRSGDRLLTGLAFHPVKTGCMPSVDPMFATLAQSCDGHVAGVLLSGMGRDGTDGAHSILEAGGSVFAQDAHSSAVWGMPRAIAESGLAAAVLPPEQLAKSVAAAAGAGAWR